MTPDDIQKLCRSCVSDGEECRAACSAHGGVWFRARGPAQCLQYFELREHAGILGYVHDIDMESYILDPEMPVWRLPSLQTVADPRRDLRPEDLILPGARGGPVFRVMKSWVVWSVYWPEHPSSK